MKITVTDVRTAESFIITMSLDARVSDVRTVISHHLSIPLEYVNLVNPGNETWKISGASDFSDERLESLARRISADCEAVSDEMTLYMTRDRVCHPGDAASSSGPSSSSSSCSSSGAPEHPLLGPPSGGNPCSELLGEAKALLYAYIHPFNPLEIAWRPHYGTVKDIYSKFDNFWELMIQLYNIRLKYPEGLLAGHIRSLEQQIVDMPVLAWISMIRNSGNSFALIAVMFRFRHHALSDILQDKPKLAFELLRVSILSGGVKFQEILDTVEKTETTLTETILRQTDSSSENALTLAAEHAPGTLERLFQAILHLPQEAQADILGRQNQDGLTALGKAARHHPREVFRIWTVIDTLKNPVLKYAIYAGAAAEIGQALIRALCWPQIDTTESLVDTLEASPQYIQIQILEQTDTDGFNPVMIAMRGRLEKYVQRFVEAVDWLPDTARIKLLFKASNNGWNCLRLAIHFHFEATLPLIQSILRIENPELQGPIFADVAMGFCYQLRQALMGFKTVNARDALIANFESYPEGIKILIMEQKDSSGSNLLVTAIAHAPLECLLRLLQQVNRFPEAAGVSILSRAFENGEHGLLRVAAKRPELLMPFMNSIARLPADAQARILGQRNAKGAMFLQIAVSLCPTIIAIIPNLLRPLQNTVVEELLYVNAAVTIGLTLIKALREWGTDTVALFVDTMEQIPKRITIHILGQTDSSGFNTLMTAIRYSSLPIQQRLLNLADSLGKKDCISLLSHTSNNGWNCPMLAAENAPLLIKPLLETMAKFSGTALAPVLGQRTHDGWRVLRIAAYHHPDRLPLLLDWIDAKDPTFKNRLMEEAGGEIGRAMHRALNRQDYDTFQLLPGVMGHGDSRLKCAILSEKDAKDNNILMAAIREDPDMMEAILNIIQEMKPKHRADMLLRQNREGLGPMQLLGAHREHPEYPRYLSILRNAFDTIHTPLALPEPKRPSAQRYRFLKPADAPILPEDLDLINAFMNALTDNSWKLDTIHGVRCLTTLTESGEQTRELRETLRKDYCRNPTGVDLNPYVEQTQAGNRVLFSCDLSVLTLLLQERHVIAVAQPAWR